MNGQKRAFPTFLVVIILLLCTTIRVEAQATVTTFTGTETYIEDLSYGEEWFPAGKNYHVRDAVSRFAVVATDPRVTGIDVVVINWNFKLVDPPVFATGPMRGTFVISNSGGTWEGTWTGVRDENGYSYFHYVGSGTGDYEGMKIFIYLERLTPDGSAPETMSGTILEPGN